MNSPYKYFFYVTLFLVPFIPTLYFAWQILVYQGDGLIEYNGLPILMNGFELRFNEFEAFRPYRVKITTGVLPSLTAPLFLAIARKAENENEVLCGDVHMSITLLGHGRRINFGEYDFHLNDLVRTSNFGDHYYLYPDGFKDGNYVFNLINAIDSKYEIDFFYSPTCEKTDGLFFLVMKSGGGL